MPWERRKAQSRNLFSETNFEKTKWVRLVIHSALRDSFPRTCLCSNEGTSVQKQFFTISIAVVTQIMLRDAFGVNIEWSCDAAGSEKQLLETICDAVSSVFFDEMSDGMTRQVLRTTFPKHVGWSFHVMTYEMQLSKICLMRS